MAPNASKQERGTELTARQAIHLIDLRITRGLFATNNLGRRRDRVGGGQWASCHRRIASYEADRRPTRRAGSDRQRTKSALEGYLFAICGRNEIPSYCGLVRPFPHRNGIMAEPPFGIGIRHNDRAMEGLPVFP